MENNPFASEEVSRRSILESLGGGGLFAGMQSILTEQAAATGKSVTDPAELTENLDDFEISAGEAAEAMATAAAENFYQTALDAILEELGVSPADIADALSSMLTDIPDSVDALEWLGKHLATIRDTIADPPEDDEGNPLWGSTPTTPEDGSPTPAKIIGSAVDDNVASSSSVGPSSASDDSLWDQVSDAATSHFDSVSSAFENENVVEQLQKKIDLKKHFDLEKLAEVIENPIVAIRPAVEDVIDEITGVLNSLEGVLSGDEIEDGAVDGINLTAPLDTGGNDLSISVESVHAALKESVESGNSSIEAPQGFSTSQTASSASGENHRPHEQPFAGVAPDEVFPDNLINFNPGSSTATIRRSEMDTERTAVPNVQNRLNQSSGDSPICGTLPGAGSGLDDWSEYAGFAQDTSANVINHILDDNYDGVGSYVCDPAKPCPVAPGATVRACGFSITLNGAEAWISGDEGDNLFNPGTEGFFGLGSKGCWYFGLDSEVLSGELRTYLKSLLEFAITIALEFHDWLVDTLESSWVADYVSEYYTDGAFCSSINAASTGSESDASASQAPTVADLEDEVNTLYDTLEDALDEIINLTDDRFDFYSQVNDDKLESIISDILSFSPPIDEAPEGFSLSYDSIEKWRTFSLDKIGKFKQRLTDGDAEIYRSLARLYDNIEGKFDRSDIPEPLRVIGGGARELTNNSTDWSSVSLSIFCANTEQLQTIVDFIQTNVNVDDIPSNIQDRLNDDSDDKVALLKDAYGTAKLFLDDYLKNHYITLLGTICKRLAKYTGMQILDDYSIDRYLAKIFETVRYIEESAVCTKIGCDERPIQPYPSPQAVAQRGPRSIPPEGMSGYDNPSGIQHPRRVYTYPNTDLETLGEVLWEILIGLAIVVVIVVIVAGLILTSPSWGPPVGLAAGAIVLIAGVGALFSQLMVRSGQVTTLAAALFGTDSVS